MLLQLAGAVLTEIVLPRWWTELPDIIKFASEGITGLGIIFLSFKKVRTKAYSIYNYFYKKLPYVRLQIQDRQTLNEIAGSVINIDRRTLITQALQWGMLDDSYDAKIITDEKGMWKRVNRTFMIWMAVPESDILGDSWVSFLSDATRKYACEKYQDAIQHQRRENFTCKLERNGIIKYDVEFFIKPVKSEDKIYAFEITIKKI